jgi:hypothetical protein
MQSRIEAWLEAAIEDARRRGLPELQPLLEALARSTEALREADERQRRRAEPGAPSEPRV